MKHRTVFTFVREPLGRFISGYAEIDRIYLGPRYEWLALTIFWAFQLVMGVPGKIPIIFWTFCWKIHISGWIFHFLWFPESWDPTNG